MSVSTEWNDGWEDDLRKEVERGAVREYQGAFDRVAARYSGGSHEDIRAALVRELETEPDESWVQAIHEGTRIVVNFEWE
jgi:hypothetical protein